MIFFNVITCNSCKLRVRYRDRTAPSTTRLVLTPTASCYLQSILLGLIIYKLLITYWTNNLHQAWAWLESYFAKLDSKLYIITDLNSSRSGEHRLDKNFELVSISCKTITSRILVSIQNLTPYQYSSKYQSIILPNSGWKKAWQLYQWWYTLLMIIKGQIFKNNWQLHILPVFLCLIFRIETYVLLKWLPSIGLRSSTISCFHFNSKFQSHQKFRTQWMQNLRGTSMNNQSD